MTSDMNEPKAVRERFTAGQLRGMAKSFDGRDEGTWDFELCAMLRQAADDAEDAERYRWLRDEKNDVALVLDKRVPVGRGLDGELLINYEYRAGDDLDAAIDTARKDNT